MPYFCILLQFKFLKPDDDEIKAVPVHAMNENAGLNVQLHCLLTVTIEGDEW
jgi:hypothetical protein